MKNHAGQAINRRVFRFTPGRADVGIGPNNRPHKAPDLEGGQSRPPLQRVLKTRRVRRKLLRLPFCVVGVDAHIDPFRRQNGNTPVGGGRTLWYRVSISHRRGGRPCPPARIVRFYGNPMRIRNILTGRCGHRPLQTASEKRNILPFCVVVVDAHIDPFRRQNGNTPAGRKGVIVQGFDFAPTNSR